MSSFSSIVISGNLGRNAELKEIDDTTVCEFSIAVTHKAKGEKITIWYKAAIWGRRGETLAPMLLKGTGVIISGALEPRTYKSKKEGIEKLSLEIRVDQLGFAGGGGGDRAGAAPAYIAPAVSASQQEEDDKIPF